MFFEKTIDFERYEKEKEKGKKKLGISETGME